MSPDEAKPAPPQFQFTALFVLKSAFELLASKAVPATERPPKTTVNFEVTASILLHSGGKSAFVKLETAVIPDQEVQPYKIEITVGGAFATTDGSPEDLVRFCKLAAPSILFPYIRETTHRLTMDAPNGVVRLDPLNITGMLNATEWTVNKVDNPEATDATEQLPPSEQSPSASQE